MGVSSARAAASDESPAAAADGDSAHGELTTAVASLTRGRGVIVVGEPGSGRTHFVQSVVAALPDPVRDRLWTGDDLNRLDDEQAERFVVAVKAGRMIPLGTAAARGPLPRDLERLIRDGILVRIVLPRVSVPTMLTVVEDALGGPLDIPSIPAFVPQREGGDLVVLQEAAREARAAGVLVSSDGVWRLGSALPPSDHLRHFVLTRATLSGAPDSDDILMLDILGLVPGVRLENARLIANLPGVDETLERLEADGAIEAFSDAGGLVLRLRDPALELVLPRTVSALRRERLTSRTVEVLAQAETATLSGGELVALAKHAWALGRTLDGDTLTRSAVAALRASQVELAFQLAQRAVAEAGGFDAQMILAAADAQLGNSAEALKMLLSIRDEARNDPDHWNSWNALTDVIRRRTTDTIFGYNLPSKVSPVEKSLTINSALRFDTAAHTVKNPSDDNPIRLHVVLEGDRLILEATIAAATGRMSRSRELVDETERMLLAEGADMFPVTMRRIYNGLMDAELGESIAAGRMLRDATATEGRVIHAARAQWALGQLLVYSGRCTEAVAELQSAFRMAEQVGMDRASMFIRAELAIALAQCGDADAAADVLDPALSAPSDEFGGPFLAIHALAWIHAANGRWQEATASFLAAAEQHAARGRSTLAVYAYYEAARAGGLSEAASRLDALSVDLDCPTMEFLIDYVRTLTKVGAAGTDAAGLARELDALGIRSAEMALHLAAAEAFARADRLYRSIGRARDATSSARRCTEQLAICGVESSPYLSTVGVPATPALSDREAEIAARAIAGESNREIAEALVLSVRTIETHLQRVYRKLGVRGRGELAAALPAPRHRRRGAQ